MTANHLADLRTIIERLDSCGRLTRVTTEVDPKFDLAGIAAHFESKPRAVLFEKVKGYDVPVFTGLYWSRELLAQLMAQEEATLPGFVSGCIQNWQKQPVPPVMVDHGPILDGGPHPLDLSTLPIPIHAIKDGGPYFDAAVVIARDPETGVRNASIQRFMVVDKDTLHINIDAGRHLGLYLEKAKHRNESLTFSLNCGVGPGLHFAAATPAEAAPPDTDELGIASEFHGAPLELVHGRTLPVHIVANAMYALECEMIPGELGDEGPFAEVTGYYASREPRPVVPPGPTPYSRPSYPAAKYGTPLDCWEKPMCWRPCSDRFPEPAMSTLAMADVGSTMLSFKSNSNVPAGLNRRSWPPSVPFRR